MNLTIREGLSSDPYRGSFELVERKGVGHPDTICDAVSEAVSRAYAAYCLETFGAVAHHWFDKVMLLGGEADIRYGAGHLLRPYQLIVAGKCAFRVGGTEIPVREIATQAAVRTLTSVLTGFDPARHLELRLMAVDHTGPGRTADRYRPASAADLAGFEDANLVSNDGNLLAGFSPLTELERLVLATEALLNGTAFKAANPDVGWDIKVFGSRSGDQLRLIVNIPFLAGQLRSLAAYQARRAEVTAALAAHLAAGFDRQPELVVNPADGADRAYLLALGSVADTGDVGVTGRGNRANGLITPMRPMSIEAPAGKNPMDHTGKLYSLLARDLAASVAAALDARVEVFLLTAKGTPTACPEEVMVNVDRDLDTAEQALVRTSVAAALGDVGGTSRRFVEAEVVMW